MKDKLIMSLILLHQELIDVVLVPISQTLRLVLRKRCAHRKACIWQVGGLFVLVCHQAQPFWAQIKRPSLTAGTKRHNTLRCNHPATDMSVYSAGLSRRPFPAASTSTKHTCTFELQLRGDVHTDANADFHQLRSLEICATQLLSSSQLVLVILPRLVLIELSNTYA